MKPTFYYTAGGVVLLCLAPFIIGELYLNLLTEIIIYSLYALSFNILLGYGGLLSFGHSVFLGVGAYVTGIILLRVPDFPFLAVILISGLGTLALGLALGSLLLKQTGPAFALLTLAFNGIFATIAIKWKSVTGGDDGICIFRPTINLGSVVLDNTNVTVFYYLCLVVIGGLTFLLWRFTKTAMGHTVLLLRENEGRMPFLGYNPALARLILFTLSATVAGVAGSFYMLFFGTVAYNIIGVEMTAIALLMTFIGGVGMFFGPMLGAAFYIYVQNLLSGITNKWPFFMGVIFIFMVLFQPKGLVGILSGLVSRIGPAKRRTGHEPQSGGPIQ